MPSFNFSVIKKVSSKPNATYQLIKEDVTGVIFINIDGDYVVKDRQDNEYNIKKNCYSCKGKTEIFQRASNSIQIVRIIREKDDAIECNPLYFVPFGIGSQVIGNIIYNIDKNIYEFDIKKIENVYTSTLSIKARSFYRMNWEVINENILKKRLHEFG